MQPDYYVFFAEHESSSTIHGLCNCCIYFNMELVLLLMIYMTGWSWLFYLGAFGQCLFLDMNSTAIDDLLLFEFANEFCLN